MDDRGLVLGVIQYMYVTMSATCFKGVRDYEYFGIC